MGQFYFEAPLIVILHEMHMKCLNESVATTSYDYCHFDSRIIIHGESERNDSALPFRCPSAWRACARTAAQRIPLISVALNVNSEWWSRKGGLRLPRAAMRKYAPAEPYTRCAVIEPPPAPSPQQLSD